MYLNFFFGENIEKRLNHKVAQNVSNCLGYIIFSKSCPICEKLPNLVTLPTNIILGRK